jgi:2-oxoglutarate ferredoxin oxidoreductase subunit beta
VPLIKAAIQHKGAAFIDVISPCVAFNNNPESTKSFDYVRAHNDAVNQLDFMEPRQAITANYAPGTVESVAQHDGSILHLRKLALDYDPCDRISAMTYLQQRHAAGEIVTGLLFVEADHGDLHEFLDTVEAPLNALDEGELCPGPEILDRYNAAHR